MAKPRTRLTTRTDLKREFESARGTADWSYFFTALIIFTAISGLNLPSWENRRHGQTEKTRDRA
jgi:hypothetical protein